MESLHHSHYDTYLSPTYEWVLYSNGTVVYRLKTDQPKHKLVTWSRMMIQHVKFYLPTLSMTISTVNGKPMMHYEGYPNCAYSMIRDDRVRSVREVRQSMLKDFNEEVPVIVSM